MSEYGKLKDGPTLGRHVVWEGELYETISYVTTTQYFGLRNLKTGKITAGQPAHVSEIRDAEPEDYYNE